MYSNKRFSFLSRKTDYETKGAFQKSELASQTMAGAVILTMK